ncbi:hypothetical protein IPH25_04525 [bacterium]|nr:MAG: hypothetical protein IPG37_01520 [bacterium]QQR61708.1 MAG: hypothetical protein IPH25_04525 [bacterium]
MKAALSFSLLLLSFYSALLSQEPERDTVEGILYQVIEKQRGILPLVNPDNLTATIGTIQMLDSLKSQTKADEVAFDLKKNIKGKEKSYESVLANYKKEISDIILEAIKTKYGEINTIIKNRTTEFQIVVNGSEGFGKTLRKIGNSAKDLFKKKILRSKTESDYSDATFKIINPAIDEPFKGNRLEYLYSELLTVTKKSLEIGQLINIYTILLKNNVSQENFETQNATIETNLDGLIKSINKFLETYSSYDEQKQQTVPYLIALTLEYRNTANAIIENSIEYLNVRVAQAKETASISKNFNTFLQQELFPTVQKITDDNVAANNSSLQHKNSQLNAKISRLQLENQALKRQVEDLRLQVRHTKITESIESAEPESIETGLSRTMRIPETSSSLFLPTDPATLDSTTIFKNKLTKSQIDPISTSKLQESLTKIDNFIKEIPNNNKFTTENYQKLSNYLNDLLNDTEIQKEKTAIQERLQKLTNFYHASHIKDIEEITKDLQTFKKTLYETEKELDIAKNSIQNKIIKLKNLPKDTFSENRSAVVANLESELQKTYKEKMNNSNAKTAEIKAKIKEFKDRIFTKEAILNDAYETLTKTIAKNIPKEPDLEKSLKPAMKKLNQSMQEKTNLAKQFETINNMLNQLIEREAAENKTDQEARKNITQAITDLEKPYAANTPYNQAVKAQINKELKERLNPITTEKKK